MSAEYLANYSLDALREEKKLLDERGISMVVSFIEEINHFPGLTLCDAVPEYYEKAWIIIRGYWIKWGNYK